MSGEVGGASLMQMGKLMLRKVSKSPPVVQPAESLIFTQVARL